MLKQRVDRRHHLLFQTLDVLAKVGMRLHPLNGPWIAGGAVRKAVMGEVLGDSDIDFCFRNAAQFEAWKIQMHDKCSVRTHVTNSGRTVSIYVTVDDTEVECQLIRGQFFNGVEEIMDDFDLTCCQFVTDGDTVYSGDDARFHAGMRWLRAANRDKLKISGKHIYRYILKGFTPDEEVLQALLDGYSGNPCLLDESAESPGYIEREPLPTAEDAVTF